MSPDFCDTVRAVAKQTIVGYAEASRTPEVREYLASGKQMEDLHASGCDAVAAT
jgi:hypothetical protein